MPSSFRLVLRHLIRLLEFGEDSGRESAGNDEKAGSLGLPFSLFENNENAALKGIC